MKVKVSRVLAMAAALVFALAPTVALADTIRLKNGSVIRGRVVGFRDEQFVVMMEPTARGRRNEIRVYVEEVESIEFDGAGAPASTDTGSAAPSTDTSASNPAPQRTNQQEPRLQGPSGNTTASQPPRNNTSTTNTAPTTQPASSNSSQFFPVRVRVRADNSSNGWTDSGLMVRKGQRLRITASGRISLGQGRFSTPTGLPRVLDTDKLMRDEPTGALIAVIGDDNDNFIFIGASREFYADRDGRLFLGVNEGNLNDNTGTFDALVEAEPINSGQVRP